MGMLPALLSMFDTATPALTLLRVAAGVRMIGPPVDGVVALLVLSGTMFLEVDDEPLREVKQGRLVLVPAGRTARLSACGSPDVTIDGRTSLVRRDGWLVAEGAGGREAALVVGAGRIAGSGPEILADIVVSAVVKCRVGKPIFTLLRAECREITGQPSLANALMSACVVQGLRRAIERSPATAGVEQSHRALLLTAIAEIKARPGDRHTIETLAKTAGMSRSSFIRHFTRTMRTGPADYIRQVRLEEARAMLETTTLSITTIAERCGFPSRSHFSRAFRAAFANDPTGYRDGTT